MRVDNGERRRLVIEGIFDGEAGCSRGLLAFIPNVHHRKPEQARGGTLDGDAVRLTVSRDGDGPIYLARFEALT